MLAKNNFLYGRIWLRYSVPMWVGIQQIGLIETFERQA